MSQEIELTGVVRGKKTIELDEETFLPDGYHARLRLVLEPGEGLKLACGAWADMTPEEVADLEAILSRSRGRVIKLANPEQS